MLRYALKRLWLLALMLFGLICITFAISNIAPADPAALAAGPDADRATVESVRHEYGLDQPLPRQFLGYVGDLAQGRLGRSIVTGRPVFGDLCRYFPATIELVGLSMLLAIGIGVPVGMLSAVYKDGWIDHLSRVFAVSGIALPAFWLGLVLQLVFSVQLGWLPTSGRLPLSIAPPQPIAHLLLIDSLLRGEWGTFAAALRYAVLPAVVLCLPCLASILRVNRAEMVDILESDYVTAARAHGIAPLRIVARYALKNAMLPTLAIIGLRFGWMLGGTVIVETVFDWPGIGLYVVSSAIASDFKPVMGVTLLIGMNFMLVNLAIDLAYGWLDPRLRTP
jgi:peptide/nickel transport system permease protein